MKCMHDGCKSTTVVDCIPRTLQDLVDKLDISRLSETARQEVLKQFLEYYCLEHAPMHGYCWHCGTEDPAMHSVPQIFSNGLCPECYAGYRREELNSQRQAGGDGAAEPGVVAV